MTVPEALKKAFDPDANSIPVTVMAVQTDADIVLNMTLLMMRRPDMRAELMRMLEERHQARERIAEVTLQEIYDTFKNDLDRGYKTRDKEYAVDTIKRALEQIARERSQ